MTNQLVSVQVETNLPESGRIVSTPSLAHWHGRSSTLLYEPGHDEHPHNWCQPGWRLVSIDRHRPMA